MTLYNIVVEATSNVGTKPSKVRQVQNPTASSVTAPAINPGEPVAATLGNQYATSLATAKPVVGSDWLYGISEDYSTESGSNDGVVHVSPVDPNVIYLCNVTTASAINTQTKYNALVGFRVVFTKSAANNTGIYTVNTTDSANNGLYIENNDITVNPGKIAFSIRAPIAYNFLASGTV